jgi:small-conductance mechanosensitive channel
MGKIEIIRKILVFANIPFIQNIILTVSTIVFFYILGGLINRIVNREVHDVARKYRLRKITYHTNIFIILFFVFIIWIHKISTVTTVIAFTSVGIIYVLQDLILSIAGWAFIMIRAPYSTGDRIEISNIKGDILDIRLFQTVLMEVGNWVGGDQSTGRVISFPNSFAFKHMVFNYSTGFPFIWNEIKAQVTYESNWKKAEEIILNIVNEQAEGIENKVKPLIKEMANKYLIQYSKLTPITYINIKDSGVEITLRYLTEIKDRRNSEDFITRTMLEAFTKEEDIDFAYPTIRYYQ